MRSLIAAELLKLTKRPLTWILLVIFLVMMLIQMLIQFLFVNLSLLLGNALSGPLAGQMEEWGRRTVFPGLIGAILSQINGIGGIFAVIFAAGAMGSEYSWGTLRTQLARTPSRTRYLLAKVATIMLLLAAATLIALLFGMSVGGILGMLIGNVGTLDARALFELPLALLRALYVLLPYVLLTVSLCVVGRSLLVGLAGGLFYLVFEAGFGALAAIQLFGGIAEQIYNLILQQNINTLVLMNNHAFGLQPELLTSLDMTRFPSPFQATLVVAIYSAAFLGTAIYLLRRRDITGAG